MERSNNTQSAAWNYKSLIVKTFDRNTLKMKAGCKSHWGDKQQKTIFPVVFRLDVQFGFARPFLLPHRMRNWKCSLDGTC